MGPRFHMLMPAAALGVMLAGAGAAHAQFRDDPDAPQVSVDFGWDGVLVPGRWCPVRINLTCGERAFGGAVRITYTQDSTQAAEIIVPAAGTPGRTVPVDTAINVPFGSARLEIALLDGRGRVARRLTYDDTPSGRQLPMPELASGQEPLIGVVRGCSLHEAVDDWTDARRSAVPVPGADGRPTPEDVWRRMRAAPVAPDALPRSWAPYEGLAVLALDAESALRIDPRARAAILEWVDSGGRLVVVADAAGSWWRRWLPEGEAGDLVEVGEGRRVPTPVSIARAGGALAAEEAAERAASDSADGATGDAEDRAHRDEERPSEVEAGPGDAAGAAPDDPGEASEPAAATIHEPVPVPEFVQARAIRLTERGRLHGWSVRWRPDGAPDPAAAAMPIGAQEGEGLLAEGPVGFGWVTILGVEPRRLGGASAHAVPGAWRDAIAHALEGRIARLVGEGGWWGADPDQSAHRAAWSAVESITSVPAVERGAVAGGLVVASCVLLALCLGPVDYLVFRCRGRGPRTWATALGWIGLASGLAYALPLALHSGGTRVGRLTVIDATPTGARAWQTGVTSIFAGRSGAVRTEGVNESSWWRGVSVLEPLGARRTPSARFVLTPGGAWGPADGAGGAASGDSPGLPLRSLGVRVWTLRTFVDHAPVPVPARAALRRAADDWELTVAGLPENARVLLAHWTDGTGLHAVEGARFESRADGTRRARTADPPAAWDAPPPVPDGWLPVVEAGVLPGSIERGGAVQRHLRTGRWALVVLYVEGLEMDVGLGAGGKRERRAELRLLAPVEGPDGQDAGTIPGRPDGVTP